MTTPRQALLLSDARLTRLMQKNSDKCATISEYSDATGLPVDRIIDILGDNLENGILKLEPTGPEIFLHTAPSGRPTPSHLPETQPNLWELLRSHGEPSYAYAPWKIYRGLEFAGWNVEPHQNRITARLARLQPPPELGVYVDAALAPALLHPLIEQLGHPAGPLNVIAMSGAHIVAVVVDENSLDAAVTSVRHLHHDGHAQGTAVLILEAPAYHPVAVTPGDAAIPTTGTGTSHL